MTNYLMLIFSDILLAITFAVNKIYQKHMGVSIKAGFLASALMGLFSATIFFIVGGFKFSFTPFSLVMAITSTLLVTAYTIISYKILKFGTMALYTLFLMSGGMIIPYIWGLLFLGEKFSILRTLALLLIVIAIIIGNPSDKNSNKKMIYMCLAIFVLNGFVSVTLKLHQIEENFATVNESDFVVLSGFVRFLISGSFWLFLKKDKNSNDKISNRKTVSLIVLMLFISSAISGISSVLQLNGASNLPATVVYPVITGGSIVFSSIAGMIMFKEKVTKRLMASIVICFAATLMFL